MNKSWTRALRFVAAVIVALGTIGNAWPTSSSGDVTDTWWNRKKPGNGYQLTNTGTFVFLTGYVFGPSREPLWLTGELTLTDAGTWTGPVYVTTGPPLGGPYDALTVESREAGTMTFVQLDVDNGRLDYTVDNLVVSEPLQRQPLTLDNYNGFFAAVLTATSTNCFDPSSNTTVTEGVAVQIVQDASNMRINTAEANGRTCSLAGTYTQLGRSGTFRGPYSCSSGEVGSAIVFELNNHIRQFNGRVQLASTNNGCRTTGRITGLIPNPTQ